MLPAGAAQLASYRSPVGRLASLEVGERLQLPTGKLYEVVERARLNPVRGEQEWDSRPSVLEDGTYGFLTVESFRDLLSRVSSVDVDEEVLERLLSEEVELANVAEGIRTYGPDTNGATRPTDSR